MRFLAVFLLIVLMFVYATIGGVIFHYIEINNENEIKISLNNSLYSNIGTCVSYDDIVNLNSVSNDLFSAGVFVKKDATTIRYSFWDYRSAILSSINSLTLVGDPAFSPRTSGGSVFAIFYILIGQFLFYLTYVISGHLIFSTFSRIWRICRNSFLRAHLGFETLVKYIVLAIIGMFIFLLIPAAIFSKIERWNFGGSFYFVFASLLSIGFYDVPTLNPNLDFDNETMQWYRLCYGFWLLITYLWFGGILLAYFIFTINLLQDEAEVGCDIILKDIDIVKKKIRPQIPAPAVDNVYQYPGYMIQPANIMYNGNITNIVVPK